MSEPGGRPVRPSRPWPERTSLDQALIERLNREWRITAPDTAQRTLKQRLAGPLRQAFTVLFRPQETFNSAVVQQINRSNELTAQRHDVLRGTIEDIFSRTEVLFDRVEGLSRLLDTRMAEFEATLDDVRRFPESMAARERRIEAGMAALRGDHHELRTAVGVLQHEARHLAKAIAPAPGGAPAPAAAAAPAPVATESSDPLSHKYVGFEDAFRGSPEAIRAGLAAYVPLFAGASHVLDVGCGRGEFLSLLRDAGITARGIDLNEAMVEVCRERGLEATAADALAYLDEQPDGSLGGLFAAQVVEHLQPGYLTRFLDTAFDKLRPGALIVLETINPACWFAFFESYIRDITHQRALHPDTLTFLLVASGFQQAEIRYSAPYPEHEKLQPIAPSHLPADAAETLNANVEKINRLLFTHLDYAAIARRP